MRPDLVRRVAELTAATRRTRDEIAAALAKGSAPAAAGGPGERLLAEHAAIVRAVAEVLDRQLALINVLRDAMELPEAEDEPSVRRRRLALVPPPATTEK